MDVRIYGPSMETNLRFGDTVVRGVITSDGIESDIPDYNGTEYTFKVTEHLMGASDAGNHHRLFLGRPRKRRRTPLPE